MIKEILHNINNGVDIWEQKVTIPTYPIGQPDKNPMFFEKRVYQGSSGKVYPHSVIDKIYDEKVNKEYTALCMENKYLFVMVLPELGGRIQRAYDKTNGYDFVYYNHVIKPALVGLTGPWISGGIEFNWPQHHRPSTFDPIDYKIDNNDDGSCTIWVGEIENMFRTKGMAGFTLLPDCSYIKIDAKIYNRTDTHQTFLWWANPAVAANDNTQSVFPPDVHAVMDHGKRAVSKFPIATGTYYKQDYSAGVDISKYKNIPVPTSYMAYQSKYDFVGGYDYGVKAGILHIADHHISPGKKQWTWGCGEFGKAWDCNLTDNDGPYIELMTGCFTDNQPDFTWLAPYEEKVFTQYFMPYKEVGMVKNATKEAAIGVNYLEHEVRFLIYATAEYPDARIVVRNNKQEIQYQTRTILSPNDIFKGTIAVDKTMVEGLSITVYDKQEHQLVKYVQEKEEIEKFPEPAEEIPIPAEVKTVEDLYLYGQHIEQYRHASFQAEDYYIEGLKRDATDMRINNAYGKLLMNRGKFKDAESYLKESIKKATRSNPNPYDGEPHYNLGLCLKYQNKLKEAFDSFYKATWNAAFQAAGFYQLASISAEYGNYEEALEFLKRSLIYNGNNTKASTLACALLRRLGRIYEAMQIAQNVLKIDNLNYGAMYESSLLTNDQEIKKKFAYKMGQNFNWCIEVALEYTSAGLFEDAIAILEYCLETKEDHISPLIYYHLAYNFVKMQDQKQAEEYWYKAATACSDYCFPHRLEDLIVLEKALENHPEDARGWYYIGNLWYDKKQYQEAILAWEASEKCDDAFPITHRNLALAYFNKLNDSIRAKEELEKAFYLNQEDARVFMELDQLYKKIGLCVEERKEKMENHWNIVQKRDDIYLEYISLCNFMGEYGKAMQLIEQHHFHPWEGGEGRVPAQYVYCLTGLAKEQLERQDYNKAIQYLERAVMYPENLGEGRLAGNYQNDVYYFLGLAYQKSERAEQAEKCFEQATKGISEPVGMIYYNDQPPEMIFYQGLALQQLGRIEEAFSRFNKLIDYGERHIFDHVKTEYFAVSLPDLLIFDENLDSKNKVHCLFLMGLGYIGKEDYKKAENFFIEAGKLNNNHMGIHIHHLLLQKIRSVTI